MGTPAGGSLGSSRAVAVFRGVVAVGTSIGIVGVLMPRGLSADGHPSGSASEPGTMLHCSAPFTCAAPCCLKAALSPDYACALRHVLSLDGDSSSCRFATCQRRMCCVLVTAAAWHHQVGHVLYTAWADCLVGQVLLQMHTLLVHASGLQYIWKLKLAVWPGRQARVVQLGEPKSEEHAVSCMAFSLQASNASS